MNKADARKLTRDELHERRQQVVRLYKEGMPVMQIVERIELSWSAVKAAIKRYQAEGDSGLRPAARGRKQGSGRTLTAEQESEIRQFIRRRRPWFYRLKKALWDRDAVTKLIEMKCGVDLSERVVGNYLKRWGLTSKKPTRLESGQCTQEIRDWLAGNYAEIEQQAREERVEIYWLRKPVMIYANAWYSTSVEQLPVAGTQSGSSKNKLSIVSAVTNQGKVCFAINKPKNRSYPILPA